MGDPSRNRQTVPQCSCPAACPPRGTPPPCRRDRRGARSDSPRSHRRVRRKPWATASAQPVGTSHGGQTPGLRAPGVSRTRCGTRVGASGPAHAPAKAVGLSHMENFACVPLDPSQTGSTAARCSGSHRSDDRQPREVSPLTSLRGPRPAAATCGWHMARDEQTLIAATPARGYLAPRRSPTPVPGPNAGRVEVAAAGGRLRASQRHVETTAKRTCTGLRPLTTTPCAIHVVALGRHSGLSVGHAPDSRRRLTDRIGPAVCKYESWPAQPSRMANDSPDITGWRADCL
jgi:hypothetical protein